MPIALQGIVTDLLGAHPVKEEQQMDSEAFLGRSEVPRRTFCTHVLLASTALAIGGNGPKVEGSEKREPEIAYPPMKIEGAESVMPGAFLYFSYPTPNDAAILVRGQEGEYRAYSRKCAHLGCSVDFNRMRQCLICPCHRGAYDPHTGFVLFGPPPRPLDPIVLQMRAGGQVWAVGKMLGNSNRDA
jgi:Rieske Fe-S protein